ncbi:hypothetical protein HNR19_000094 [Nocardioides thalensis]|uniref:Uncharacterized protein n=1 Tax=Nocardioides thalensis TaxID=1914755 RepID=A0A853BXA5_9ACTN|nr:hypothetical protein [Nocardioides thalensis]NYI99395.1 hypothetical protein [Nocardioides thalensis]
MSDRRDLWSRVGAGLLILVVLALVLLVRPGGTDDAGPGPEADPSTSPSGPGPTGPPATDGEFCRAFRALAAAQSVYVATPDARGAELLREAAAAVVAMGPPESMPIEARGGLFTALSGIYGSLGETLPPSAVPGAADGPQVAGSDQAFSGWLNEYCPA